MENAERAVTVAAEATGAVVSEYTAGPRYMTLHGRGAHEWIVEFGRAPESFDAFVQKLDGELMRLNSDYEAKRRSTMAPPEMHVVPAGTFARWMLRRGKNKVPRLANDRRVLEDVLATTAEQDAAVGVRGSGPGGCGVAVRRQRSELHEPFRVRALRRTGRRRAALSGRWRQERLAAGVN